MSSKSHRHCRFKSLAAGVVLLAFSLALAGSDSFGQGVDADRYLTLRDSRLRLLRKEDGLKQDILNLRRDISELYVKLEKKLDSLRDKQRQLGEVGLDIRDLEKLM
jgi:hypothetical protein